MITQAMIDGYKQALAEYEAGSDKDFDGSLIDAVTEFAREIADAVVEERA